MVGPTCSNSHWIARRWLFIHSFIYLKSEPVGQRRMYGCRYHQSQQNRKGMWFLDQNGTSFSVQKTRTPPGLWYWVSLTIWCHLHKAINFLLMDFILSISNKHKIGWDESNCAGTQKTKPLPVPLRLASLHYGSPNHEHSLPSPESLAISW
jgi:hypothetical protein